MSKLFIIEGNQTKVIEQNDFSNEAILQDVVEKFPEVIALEDLGLTEPLIVIGREVSTPAGYIDVLCVDGEGILTVIETKLARNSQIRREVIGQILEYAAQITKWRAHDVIKTANQYLASKKIKNEDRPATIQDLLLKEEEDTATGTVSIDVYDMIETNLRKGIIKLIIASDNIPETLKDTVTFINSYSNFDIYVLQIQSYQNDQLQIYAPKVFGFTHKAIGTAKSDKVQWDEESFIESLSRLDRPASETIKKLYSFSQEHASGIQWGVGKSCSSFSYRVNSYKKKFNIFAILNSGVSGVILINFGSMKTVFSDENLHDFRNSLNKLPNIDLTELVVNEGKYPSISVECVIQPENYEIFTNAVLKLHAVVDMSKKSLNNPSETFK